MFKLNAVQVHKKMQTSRPTLERCQISSEKKKKRLREKNKAPTTLKSTHKADIKVQTEVLGQ